MVIFLSLVSCLFFNLIQATVMSIEELYNPELNQTVVLAGDYHFLSEDEVQCKDIIDLIKKHDGHCIIEGLTAETKSGTLLPNILKKCEESNLSSSNAEVRNSIANWITTIYYMTRFANSSDVKREWQDSKELIFDLFCDGYKEGDFLIKGMKNFVSSLPKEDIRKTLFENKVKEAQGLLDQINSVLPPQKEDPEEEINSIINFLVDNIFMDDSTGSIILNKDSVSHKLEEIGSLAIEFNILRGICTHNNKKLILVGTGQIHANNISKALALMGYVSKASVTKNPKFDKDRQALMAENNFEISSLSQLNKYGIDINDFSKRLSISN